MAVNRLRILCVDDNHDIADSEALLLELYGFETRACYDGENAIIEAGDFCPDVYLLDLNMPGMDGCELARELRARFSGPPPYMVAITAKGAREDYRRTKEAGFDTHLVKPVNPVRLAEMLAGMRHPNQE
jgi:two-component system OmpR family response regulator